MSKKYKVDIIVPIYNSLNWVKICVKAIFLNTNYDILGKVYLINDCSSDTKMKEYLSDIERKYGDLVEVINNKENLGFLKTCNKGLKKFKSDYVLLLNTDCIVSKNAIEKMADAMHKDKKIGLLCPIASVSANLSYGVPAGLNFMQLNELFEKNFKGKTFLACTVVGNCLMISKECVKKVGLFDEIFGKGYTEETDYHFKALQKGFKARVLIDTFVYHQSRVTFGESEKQLEIRKEHLEIFFKRWNDEYNRELEKFLKNNPIDYINNNLDLSNVTPDDTITLKNGDDIASVAKYINVMMLNGINIKLRCTKEQLDSCNEIMLFSPEIIENTEKKNWFRNLFRK